MHFEQVSSVRRERVALFSYSSPACRLIASISCSVHPLPPRMSSSWILSPSRRRCTGTRSPARAPRNEDKKAALLEVEWPRSDKSTSPTRNPARQAACPPFTAVTTTPSEGEAAEEAGEPVVPASLNSRPTARGMDARRARASSRLSSTGVSALVLCDP